MVYMLPEWFSSVQVLMVRMHEAGLLLTGLLLLHDVHVCGRDASSVQQPEVVMHQVRLLQLLFIRS
jgi:hypothetical protein